MHDEKCEVLLCGHIYFGTSSLITDQFLTCSLLSHLLGNILTYFIHSWGPLAGQNVCLYFLFGELSIFSSWSPGRFVQHPLSDVRTDCTGGSCCIISSALLLWEVLTEISKELQPCKLYICIFKQTNSSGSACFQNWCRNTT